MLTALRKLPGRLVRYWHRLRLDPIIRQVKNARLTYLSETKLAQLQNAISSLKAHQVPGDVVEFGVALGGSGIVLAHLMGSGRNFHGLDVFGMIPPPTSEKDDAKSKERYAIIKSGQSTGLGGDEYYGYKQNLLDEVKANFRAFGHPVDDQHVHLHPGLFEESWPTVEPMIQSITLAHIDCDWYEPVKFCLNAVAPKLPVNGRIIMDDYNDYGGCRTATDEFLRDSPNFSPLRNLGNLTLVRTR